MTDEEPLSEEEVFDLLTSLDVEEGDRVRVAYVNSNGGRGTREGEVVGVDGLDESVDNINFEPDDVESPYSVNTRGLFYYPVDNLHPSNSKYIENRQEREVSPEILDVEVVS